MGNFPLAALTVRPPEQQPSILDLYAKIQGLRNQQQQQQIGAAQLTGINQENEQRAITLKGMQTIQQIAPNHVQKDSDGNVTGFDYDGLQSEALAKGVPMPVLSQLTTMRKNQSDALLAQANVNSKVFENEAAKNKQAYEVLEGVRGISDPVQQQNAYQVGLGTLKKMGVDTSKLPPQLPTDPGQQKAMFDMEEAGLATHAQAIADAKIQAETNQANQKANLDKMEAQEKGSPLTKMENDPTMFAGQNLPASMAYLQGKVNDPDPATAARATRLLNTAKVSQANQLALDASKKATDQAIQDGDPNAAAKLLVDGTVAPSQIISARKPEFAQKAFTAAQQLQPGWDARKAEGDFKVASSPAQVAFFGSAKSLTDKGGTLDQLAAAAKDIPQGQIPVFNTVADAIKASTGSGPIAKYASIALGVADDYSKVMGGGQGSDTSRTQALQLISAKQSPEQRAASIEGIRGAVGSQLNSRIGSNPVLKKMYGDAIDVGKSNAEHVPGGKAAGLTEGQTGTGSDGKKYIVKGGVWVPQ